MAYILSQSIPSELQDLWDNVLRVWPWVSTKDRAGKRLPFRIPTLQGCRTIRRPVWQGYKVTEAMCAHRKIFGLAVACYNIQPYSGGATPPAVGPRNRSWWYSDPLNPGFWYFNWFMKKTIEAFVAQTVPDWCALYTKADAWLRTTNPDANEGAYIYIIVKNQDPNFDREIIRGEMDNYSKLWIYNNAVSKFGGEGPPYKIECYAVSANWQENTVTWNNQPALGELLDTYTHVGTDPRWISFDVKGHGSVILLSPTSSWIFSAYSKENAHVAERPYWET